MRYFVECDYDDATHFAHPVHENNTIDLSESSVKIKPFIPPNEEEIKQVIHDICVLQERIYTESDQHEIAKLEKRQKNTIISLWGGKNQE